MRRQEREPKKTSGQMLIPALTFSSSRGCAELVLKVNTLCKSDVESSFQTDDTLSLSVYNCYLSLVSLHTKCKASALSTHAVPLSVSPIICDLAKLDSSAESKSLQYY